MVGLLSQAYRPGGVTQGPEGAGVANLYVPRNGTWDRTLTGRFQPAAVTSKAHAAALGRGGAQRTAPRKARCSSSIATSAERREPLSSRRAAPRVLHRLGPSMSPRTCVLQDHSLWHPCDSEALATDRGAGH